MSMTGNPQPLNCEWRRQHTRDLLCKSCFKVEMMNAEQAADDRQMKPALHLGLWYNYCSILTITNIQSSKNSQCGGAQKPTPAPWQPSPWLPSSSSSSSSPLSKETQQTNLVMTSHFISNSNCHVPQLHAMLYNNTDDTLYLSTHQSNTALQSNHQTSPTPHCSQTIKRHQVQQWMLQRLTYNNAPFPLCYTVSWNYLQNMLLSSLNFLLVTAIKIGHFHFPSAIFWSISHLSLIIQTSNCVKASSVIFSNRWSSCIVCHCLISWYCYKYCRISQALIQCTEMTVAKHSNNTIQSQLDQHSTIQQRLQHSPNKHQFWSQRKLNVPPTTVQFPACPNSTNNQQPKLGKMFTEYLNNPKTKSTRGELQVCKADMMACCRHSNRQMHNIIGVCNVQLHVPDEQDIQPIWTAKPTVTILLNLQQLTTYYSWLYFR